MTRAGWLIVAVLSFGWVALPTSSAAGDGKKGGPVDFGGLKSTPPAAWVPEEPKSTMRLAQFKLPRAKDDTRDAELVIFYFGESGGGKNADNIKRQKNLFVPPDGKKIDDVTTVTEEKVAGNPVTFAEIHGTYKDKPGPMVPDDQAVLRPNYRLVYVIFESPKGLYYVRLVGPSDTVEHHKKAVVDWVKGFK